MVDAAEVWDITHMQSASGEATPLQIFLQRAIDAAPKTRGYYDKLLQERLGTKGKPLYDIHRGKIVSPSIATVQAIAEVLGQPRELLLRAMDGEDVHPAAASNAVAKVRPTSDHLPTRSAHAGDGAIALKQIDMGFSMGPGANIDDYVEEGTLDFDAGLLRSITRSPADRLYVARGDGDSMFPTLVNDDMVIFDTLQRQLNLQDRIWACSIHGAGAIKRLRSIGKGRVLVISDNAAVDNQEVDADDLVIVGRVIWVGRRV
ncbi:Peptidase S24-like [Sphingomonas laterariae]|uniref:Peptidase S24-like n=2 Tax=Edaphosphingomonas laterariae TaxID=861865 RepID=A0A239JJE5_9SPHN|nr:Peptidase S24-like [Sphingomonas laterariae]